MSDLMEEVGLWPWGPFKTAPLALQRRVDVHSSTTTVT